MKKRWITCLLALTTLLFPACEMGADGGSSSTGSSDIFLEDGLLGGASDPAEGGLGNNGSGNPGAGNGGSAGNNGCVHKDDDGNEICDSCKESVIVTIDFYAMNDLHGKFADEDSSIGVDELSTYFTQKKQANPNTVLLASGDMWQGGSASNTTEGKIVTEWMNEMGFVSMSMGNHEYDWSRASIEANDDLADFPFLAINLYDEATDQRVDYCDASVMVEVDGLQIGIIGAIGNCESSIAADKREGLEFKVGGALTTLVQAEANALRLRGADYIVYSFHGDHREKDEYDLALSNGYVDLVFEGHTHQTYCVKDGYGVYHVQGGGYGSGLSQAQVQINCVTGEVLGTTAKTVSSSTYSSLSDHPIVEELLEKYKDQISIADEVLGYNETYRSKAVLSRTVAQLYYEAGVEKWGSQYSILGGGGNINVRAPGTLPVGEVKFGDLIDLFPFDNSLVLCSIQGSVLKTRFYDQENADSPYFFYDGGFGKANVKDNETYYIVTDTWNAPYAANQLTKVADYDATTFARHLLAQHIREGGFGTNPSGGSGSGSGTSGGGTQTPDPTPSEPTYITIARALEIGSGLSANIDYAEKYLVRGQITNIESGATQQGVLYGNMTIKDGRGNSLYVYGSFDTEGNRYGEMANPPQVGDIVTLQAPLFKYQNDSGTVTKIELKNADIVEFITPTSVAQAVAIGGGLTENETTAESYYVYGTVEEIRNASNGCMMIKDADGTEIYVYKPVEFSSLQVGSVVVFYGKIQRYMGTQADQQIQVSKPALYAVL